MKCFSHFLSTFSILLFQFRVLHVDEALSRWFPAWREDCPIWHIRSPGVVHRSSCPSCFCGPHPNHSLKGTQSLDSQLKYANLSNLFLSQIQWHKRRSVYQWQPTNEIPTIHLDPGAHQSRLRQEWAERGDAVQPSNHVTFAPAHPLPVHAVPAATAVHDAAEFSADADDVAAGTVLRRLQQRVDVPVAAADHLQSAGSCSGTSEGGARETVAVATAAQFAVAAGVQDTVRKGGLVEVQISGAAGRWGATQRAARFAEIGDGAKEKTSSYSVAHVADTATVSKETCK